MKLWTNSSIQTCQGRLFLFAGALSFRGVEVGDVIGVAVAGLSGALGAWGVTNGGGGGGGRRGGGRRYRCRSGGAFRHARRWGYNNGEWHWRRWGCDGWRGGDHRAGRQLDRWWSGGCERFLC